MVWIFSRRGFSLSKDNYDLLVAMLDNIDQPSKDIVIDFIKYYDVIKRYDKQYLKLCRKYLPCMKGGLFYFRYGEKKAMLQKAEMRSSTTLKLSQLLNFRINLYFVIHLSIKKAVK